MPWSLCFINNLLVVGLDDGAIVAVGKNGMGAEKKHHTEGILMMRKLNHDSMVAVGADNKISSWKVNPDLSLELVKEISFTKHCLWGIIYDDDHQGCLVNLDLRHPRMNLTPGLTLIHHH